MNRSIHQVTLIFKKILLSLKSRCDLACLAVVLPVIISFWHVNNIRSWQNPNRVIAWDVINYYSYLPAKFIYKDITLKFTDRGARYPEVIFWYYCTENNQYVIKSSMGMSYMYAPFFFIAHATVGLTDYNPSGFSPYYKYFLVIGGILYYFLGLIILRKILLRYFNQLAVFLTIIAVALGTNLLYYSSTEVTMPHVYIFTLTNLFVYCTIRWYESPGILITVVIGIVTGLISLIRPVNITIIFFFIFWNIRSWHDIMSRVYLFKKYSHHLVLIGLMTFVIWIPQFHYWKTVTGHWIFYSYIDERFFFLNPQILNGLFSFRKGWFLYNPVMAFVLAGLPVLLKHRKGFFWAVLILFAFHVYIIYSWWCWWYGGSLGSRPMIDIYGILSIPIAAFLQWALEQKKRVRVIILTLFLLLGLKGTHFNIQYYYGAVHWDGMTRLAYMKSFFRTLLYEELGEIIKTPDYKRAMEGKEDYFLN